MAKISTMNLSIESLEKWREEKKLTPSSVPKILVKEEPFSADAMNLEDNFEVINVQPSPAREERINNRTVNQVTSSTTSTQLNNLSKGPPMTQIDVENSQHLLQDFESSSAALYTNLMDMTSLGLKMCQNEEKTRALINKRKSSTNMASSTSHGTESDDGTQVAELLNVIAQTRQLHQDLLNKISMMANGTFISTCQSRIENLEKNRLEDKKEIAALKQKVISLTSEINQLKSRPTRSGESQQAGSRKESDIELLEEISESDSDSSTSEVLNMNDSDLQASSLHSSVWTRPELPPDIENSIDEINLKMKRHGLLCRNVVSWAESRAEPLSWNLKFVGRFLSKKLSEEESRTLMSLYNEFLDDMINDQGQRKDKTRQLPKRVEPNHSTPSKSSLRNKSRSSSRSSRSSSRSSSSSSGRIFSRSTSRSSSRSSFRSSSSCSSSISVSSRSSTSPERMSPPTSASKVPKPKKCLPESSSSEEDIIDNPERLAAGELSAETQLFIDYTKKEMVRRGLSYKDLIAWSKKGDIRLDLRVISHFMHKKMKEDECICLIPYLKEFLEGKRSTDNQRNSAKPTEAKRRQYFSRDQRRILEQTFKKNPLPSPTEKIALSNQLKVSELRICQWFKSRRARLRKTKR